MTQTKRREQATGKKLVIKEKKIFIHTYVHIINILRKNIIPTKQEQSV